MRMEIIALRCRREIIFWMSKIADAGTSARSRNRSQIVSNQTVHVDMNVDTGIR